MRWLTRRLSAADRDRGAAALIVALVLSVVLLGMGAIVLDIGDGYAERAQVQNAADAGALAVAQTCAAGACQSSAASNYTDNNSNHMIDTTSVVTQGFPCGISPLANPKLPNCVDDAAAGCPAAPANGAPYVDVHTLTSTGSGGGPLPPLLGKALDPTDNGHKVGACAQASWGPPSSLGDGSALTMSACEWSKDTADGSVFAQVPSFNSNGAPNYGYVQNVPPGLPSYLDTLTARRSDSDYDTIAGNDATNFYVASKPTIKDPHASPRLYRYPDSATPIPARDAGAETVLTTIGFGNNCKAGNSGTTAPGQFGWLSNTSCSVIIDGSTYGGAPGASSAPCETAFTASRNTGKPIFLPVYDAVSGTGNGAQYTLLGFAAFVVTGWDMTNASAGNWTVKKAPSLVTLADPSLPVADANYCNAAFTGSNANQCVYGFFTQALISQSDLPQPDPNNPPPKNLGATAVYLSG